MYNNFALIYDELMEDVDYEGWYSYITDILNRFNKNPQSMLEMACGTGNLSWYLAKDRYKLTCFDSSDDMLSIAYNKLNRYKNVTILNQNMIDFNIHEKFDCIVSICDSINYITDNESLLQTFINVRNHLKDDGIFIFDINSCYKLKNIIGDNIFVEDRENIFYTWQNYFDEDNNISEFYLTFFVKNNNGNYVRFDEEHIERAYTIEEVVELLHSANFNKIHYFDAFNFNSPNEKSERINFIALPQN